MKDYPALRDFERMNEQIHESNPGRKAAKISLELGFVSMMFADIKRIPRYANGERETDVEHSFMLALVAPEIAVALDLSYDPGLLSQFAVVHDLIELKTGDIATFLATDDEQLQKELIEQAAIRELAAQLPPHTASMLERYESQEEPEARFVRYIDKLLPVVVDIIGNGVRVMKEDYGASNLSQLEECHKMLQDRLQRKFNDEFPDIEIAHKLLCELFEATYQLT